MKWCVIGAGGIADRRFIPALLEDKDAVLVAVMDRVSETAEKIGKKYGVPYYTDEKEMLENTDADAVYIGTPVFCHKAQILLSAQMKKHILVEKPLAMNAEEGEEVLAACREAGVQLTVGYMMKYHSLHEKAKELVKEGGIGQISNIHARFSCWYPDIPGAWRQTRALGGGGALMDLGVHCIELITFLLDEEIAEVAGFCTTRTFSYEVEDGAVLIFRTAKGVLGHIDVAFNVPDAASQSKFEIFGTEGYLLTEGTLAQEEVGTLSHLYAPQGAYDAAQAAKEPPKPVLYRPEGKNLYLRQIREFVSAIEAGCDYFYTERAIEVQRVVDTIYDRK